MLRLGLVGYIILSFAFLGVWFWVLRSELARLRSDRDSMRSLFEASEKNRRLLESNVNALNRELSFTAKVYGMARDICMSLDETKLFENFKKDLKDLVVFRECRLVSALDVAKEQVSADKVIFPLKAQDADLGVLVAEGVESAKIPFLSMLASQFALSLRRARLYHFIQEMAITDSLTGLYTRRYAYERLKEEYVRSKSQGLALSFLMIDVDDFKRCNDNFGHLAGDAVLCEVAERIKGGIREVDMAARFGGEEFMVFAPAASRESAVLIAERIRSNIAASPIRAYDETLMITVSIGLATYPGDASSTEDLAGRADLALYQAKKAGKNKVCSFESLS